LRDDGNTLGEDALHVISYFLILGLMESKLKQMDMYNLTHYELGELDEEYKNRLFHILKFSNLIKEDKVNCGELLRNLWNCILSVHPLSRDIFKGNNFGIDKDHILVSILETLSKINFSDIDQDILGDAYEEVVKNTLLQGDGQFFTPPFIKNECVKLINPQVYENGQIDTIFDPAMGTGGFIQTCLTFIKNIAKEKKIKLDWDQISTNGLGGREVIDKTFQFAKANCLVYSGHIFKTIEMNDSIRVPIEKKYDCIVSNPPYGVKGLSYDRIINKNRDNYLPIVSNSAVPLFIESIINILNINGRCSIVIPNGQELFSKTDDLFNIRQLLLKSCELKEVIYFNDKSFKKTSIKVCILFFIKRLEINQVLTIEKKFNKKKIEETDKRQYKFIDSYQTNKIQFYNFDQKTNSKILLEEILIDSIITKGLSLNYKDYIIEDEEIYANSIVVKTLGEIFKLTKNGKTNSKDISNTGEYPFYKASCQNPSGTHKSYDFDDYEYLLIVKSGGSSAKPISDDYGIGKVFLVNGKCAANIAVFQLKLISNNNIKYMYYYLLSIQYKIQELANYCTNNGNIDMKKLMLLKIPIPPLSQQEDIVKYLDFIYEKCNKTSIEKINELQELNQSTLSVQKILGQNEIKTVDECCHINYGTRIVKKNNNEGEYPVYGSGRETFTTDTFNREDFNILIGRFALSERCVRLVSHQLFLNDSGLTIKPKDNNIMHRYIGYYFLHNQHMIYNCARGTAQKNLDIEKFKSIKIYIPSLSKQLELITYLNFNHDLIKQLEKEISNNKEQAKQFLSSIVKINNDLNTVSESDTDIKLDTDIKTNSESDSESDSELIEPIIKTKKTKNKNA
jgi:type I restriction-modification system DNA methylase subunit